MLYNFEHSRARIGVEWGIGLQKRYWRSLSLKVQQQVFHSSPDKCILVAVLLTNFIVCARGAQHETYFGVAAPTFSQYLEYVKSN